MRAYPFLLIMVLVFGCKQATQKVIERYPSGQVMTEYFYPDKKGTSTYTCKVYYENGKLKHETQITANMFVGAKKTFFENGNVKRIERLNHPTPLDATKYDCYITNFRLNGTKENEYQYINDKITGLTIDYDSTGNKVRTADYVDGKINGKEILYFPSGSIKSIAFVKNDTLKGFDIEFKENGDTLKWFHNGEYGLNGMFYKKWLANGLILTGQYGDSLRSNVVWEWWDQTNKLVKSKMVESKNEKYISPE